MSLLVAGDLARVRLSSLIQFAELEGIEGVLAAGEGELRFSGGALVGVQFGTLDGITALAELMLTPPPRFEIHARKVEGTPIGSTLSVILEATRLVDDWQRLAPMVLEVIPQDVPEDLQDDRLLLQFDGRLTVAEVLLLDGRPRMDLVDIVAAGFEDAWLDEAAEPAPERVQLVLEPPPTEEDFYDLLDEARDAMKRKDYSGAWMKLKRALRARPNDRTVLQNLRRLEQIRAAQGDS